MTIVMQHNMQLDVE